MNIITPKIVQFTLIGSLIFAPTVMAKTPFSSQINASGEKVLIFSPTSKAWAAYNQKGDLVRWGRASGGSDWCRDVHRQCHTPVGVFRVYSKGGFNCKSSRFPLPRGGAPMPLCMHFKGPYALHGSYDVPNYNASHGCVRLPVQDAKWLSHNFVQVGTKVVIKPYGASSSRYASRGQSHRQYASQNYSSHSSRVEGSYIGDERMGASSYNSVDPVY